MSLFKGIEDQKASTDRTPFMRAGHYLARIDRMREGKTQTDNTQFVAFDVTILHVYADGDTPKTASPDAPRDWTNQGKDGWHKTGQEVTVFYKDSRQSVQADLKAFMGNAGGLADHEVTEEACLNIREKQMLDGEVIELNNRVIEIKKSGGPFTRIWCVRRLEGAEYINILSESVLEEFFPDGIDTE